MFEVDVRREFDAFRLGEEGAFNIESTAVRFFVEVLVVFLTSTIGAAEDNGGDKRDDKSLYDVDGRNAPNPSSIALIICSASSSPFLRPGAARRFAISIYEKNKEVVLQ